MFGRNKTTRVEPTTEVREVHERPIAARGGVSLGTIITGGLVAIGAFFLLSSIVGAVLSQTGVTPQELARGDEVDAGIAGAVALLVAWFLSFIWGGYTAGRMGRGSGFLNGLLVPFAVIALAAAVGAVAWALGASEGWTLPSPTQQLQVEGEFTSVDYGLGLAAITLGVMFFGSVVGGIFGARWHTKLERKVELERNEALTDERAASTREVDLRDRETERRTWAGATRSDGAADAHQPASAYAPASHAATPPPPGQRQVPPPPDQRRV